MGISWAAQPAAAVQSVCHVGRMCVYTSLLRLARVIAGCSEGEVLV
jgi:hypothetical protein